VLNSSGAGSVVGFQLGFGGHLTHLKDATSFLTANVTGGASLAISPDGHFLAVTERLANNNDVFQIQPNGLLAPIVVIPSPDPVAFSVTFAPNGSAIFSETGPADANDGSAISSYSILSTGKLASISQGIPTLGAANCWNVVTPDETKVYVSNAGSSTISGFAIGPKGTTTVFADSKHCVIIQGHIFAFFVDKLADERSLAALAGAMSMTTGVSARAVVTRLAENL